MGRGHFNTSPKNSGKASPLLLLHQRLAHSNQSILHKAKRRQPQTIRRLRPHVALDRTLIRRNPSVNKRPACQTAKGMRVKPGIFQASLESLRLRHAPPCWLGHWLRTVNHDANWEKEHKRSCLVSQGPL